MSDVKNEASFIFRPTGIGICVGGAGSLGLLGFGTGVSRRQKMASVEEDSRPWLQSMAALQSLLAELGFRV